MDIQDVSKLCTPAFNCTRLVQCLPLHQFLLLNVCRPFKPCIKLIEPCGIKFLDQHCTIKYWIIIEETIKECAVGLNKEIPGLPEPTCGALDPLEIPQFDPGELVSRITSLEAKVKELSLKQR
jgi:hypothetical protein